MVATSDMLTVRQNTFELTRLLALLEAGGFTEPVNGTLLTFTPTQLASLKTKINTVLSTLQTFIAALTTV